MRRCLLLLGISCLVAEALCMREALTLSGGNELIWPAILAGALLLWTAGSAAGLLFERARIRTAIFAGLLGLAGWSAAISILAIRLMHWLAFSGRISHETAAGCAIAAATIPAFVSGLAVAAARSISRRASMMPDQRLLMHFFIGAAIGGGLITVQPSESFEQLRVGLAVAALLSVAGFQIWRTSYHRGNWGWMLLAATLLAAAGIITPFGNTVDFITMAPRHDDEVLRSVRESAFGRTEVIKRDSQYDYFHNGAVVIGDQAPSVARAVALGVLSHQQPLRALLVGVSPTQALDAAKAFPWLYFDCAQIDPELLDPYDIPNRDDPAWERVRFESRFDARRLLRENPDSFSAVVLVIPSPKTLLLNRYYTRLFFRDVRKAVGELGVLVMVMDAPDDYSRQLIAGTARGAFPEVWTNENNGEFYLLAGAQGSSLQEWRLRDLRAQRWSVAQSKAPLSSLRAGWSAAQAIRPGRDTLLSANSELSPLPLRDWYRERVLRLAGGVDLLTLFVVLALIAGSWAMWTAFSDNPGPIGTFGARLAVGGTCGGFVALVLLAIQSSTGEGWGWMPLPLGVAALAGGCGLALAWSWLMESPTPGVAAVLIMAAGVLAAATSAGETLLAQHDASAPAIVLLLSGVLFVAGLTATAAGGLCIRMRERPDNIKHGAFAAIPEGIGAALGTAFWGLVVTPAVGIAAAFVLLAAGALLSLPAIMLAGRRR